MPRRARRDADALPARLAHHRDLRDFRRGGRGRHCSASTRSTWPGRSAMPRRNRRGWSRASAAWRRASGSAMRRATGWPRRCSPKRGFTGPEQADRRALRVRDGDQRLGRSRARSPTGSANAGRSWPTPTSPTRAGSCCSRSSTPVSNCAPAMRRRRTDRRVVVRGHPLMRERTDRPDVDTGREARVSLQHSVAVAFLFGAAGLAQYADACVADPAVRDLRAQGRLRGGRGGAGRDGVCHRRDDRRPPAECPSPSRGARWRAR